MCVRARLCGLPSLPLLTAAAAAAAALLFLLAAYVCIYPPLLLAGSHRTKPSLGGTDDGRPNDRMTYLTLDTYDCIPYERRDDAGKEAQSGSSLQQGPFFARTRFVLKPLRAI